LQRCGDLGLASYRLFEMDPYLRSLRTTPGFRELTTALRREHDSIRDEFGLEARLAEIELRLPEPRSFRNSVRGVRGPARQQNQRGGLQADGTLTTIFASTK